MARPRTTIEDAQKKLDEKFPDKGFTLLEYNGYTKPCVLVCPKHGRQEVLFKNIFVQSKHGCPSCSRSYAASAVTAESRKRAAATLKHQYAIALQITTLLQQPLSDEQLGKELRTLLREL